MSILVEVPTKLVKDILYKNIYPSASYVVDVFHNVAINDNKKKPAKIIAYNQQNHTVYAKYNHTICNKLQEKISYIPKDAQGVFITTKITSIVREDDKLALNSLMSMHVNRTTKDTADNVRTLYASKPKSTTKELTTVEILYIPYEELSNDRMNTYHHIETGWQVTSLVNSDEQKKSIEDGEVTNLMYNGYSSIYNENIKLPLTAVNMIGIDVIHNDMSPSYVKLGNNILTLIPQKSTQVFKEEGIYIHNQHIDGNVVTKHINKKEYLDNGYYLTYDECVKHGDVDGNLKSVEHRVAELKYKTQLETIELDKLKLIRDKKQFDADRELDKLKSDLKLKEIKYNEDVLKHNKIVDKLKNKMETNKIKYDTKKLKYDNKKLAFNTLKLKYDKIKHDTESVLHRMKYEIDSEKLKISDDEYRIKAFVNSIESIFKFYSMALSNNHDIVKMEHDSRMLKDKSKYQKAEYNNKLKAMELENQLETNKINNANILHNQKLDNARFEATQSRRMSDVNLLIQEMKLSGERLKNNIIKNSHKSNMETKRQSAYMEPIAKATGNIVTNLATNLFK